MKTKFTLLALLTALIANLVALPAQAQGPTLPPGYAREMNEWFDVCDPDTLDPDQSGFVPDENYDLPVIGPTHNGAFIKSDDVGTIGDDPFYELFYQSPSEDIILWPPAYIQEDTLESGYMNGGEQCYWAAHVQYPSLNKARTPQKDFSYNVEFADVSFMFYYDDVNFLVGLVQNRPYKIVARWDDGLETTIEGTIDSWPDSYQRVVNSIDDPTFQAVAGFVSHSIEPRQNHYLSTVWIEFSFSDSLGLGGWDYGAIPSPILFVDQILIRGFYRTNVPTPTPTRTPMPLTPTATATARPNLWSTPTSVATPTVTITPLATKLLPAKYSFVPTSIPALQLPPWPPVATMAPIPTPQAINMTLIPTPNFPSHSWLPTPGEPTPTPLAWTTDVVSFTSWLSTATTINATGTFTVETAPEWYAPSLPRPLADVGWTFEQMQSGVESGQRYSLASWAAFSGYIASLPIQLTKSVMDLFRFMGPFGLFVTWLLVMLPGVLFFKIFEFIKGLVIRVFTFVLDLIRFILELIKLIPFL